MDESYSLKSTGTKQKVHNTRHSEWVKNGPMQHLQTRRNRCSHLQLMLTIHYLSFDLMFSWSLVITVVTTKVTFLYVITLQFGNHLPLYYRELLPHCNLKMETVFVSKMLVNSYQTTWCHILCDNNFDIVVMVTVNGYSSMQNSLCLIVLSLNLGERIFLDTVHITHQDHT